MKGFHEGFLKQVEDEITSIKFPTEPKMVGCENFGGSRHNNSRCGGRGGFGGGNNGCSDSDGFVVSRSFVSNSSDDRDMGRGGFSGWGGGRRGGRDDYGVRGDRGNFRDYGPRPEPYIPQLLQTRKGAYSSTSQKGSISASTKISLSS